MKIIKTQNIMQCFMSYTVESNSIACNPYEKKYIHKKYRKYSYFFNCVSIFIAEKK